VIFVKFWELLFAPFLAAHLAANPVPPVEIQMSPPMESVQTFPQRERWQRVTTAPYSIGIKVELDD
jgi:hypothetical protein